MPPGHLWRPLLAKDLRPVCFRIVSRFRQNGFIRPDSGLFFAKIRDVCHIQVDRPAAERVAGTWAGIKTIIKTKGIGGGEPIELARPLNISPRIDRAAQMNSRVPSVDVAAADTSEWRTASAP